MTTRYIQSSFASGEVSPAIYSRVDIQRYATALKTCRNFFVHAHGGASNRAGTKMVSEQGNSLKQCRLVDFVFSQTQAYALEFGHNYIRFFTDGAQIQADTPASWSSGTTYAVDDYCTYAAATYRCIQANTNKQPDTETDYWTSQTAYEIYSPYTEDDLPDLKFESSADVMYIMHPDYQTRTLTRYDNADWELDLYAPTDGPFMLENIDETVSLSAAATTGTGVTISAASAVFDADHVGALFKLTHYIEGQTASSSFTGTGTGTAIKCFTTWRVISHGTWTGKFRIEKSIDGGTTWTVLRSFTSADDFNANTYGTEDIEVNDVPFLVRINMYAYTSGTCNVDLTTDPFYQEGICQIASYVSSTEVTADILQDIGLTTDTIMWSEGSWSDYRGWPSDGTFQQDRFCLASTYSEPMTTWMSRVGNYISFGRNSLSLLDSDAISTNLLSRKLNSINGLVPLGDLLAFTTASEWKIGSDNGVLTPTTITTKVQGYRGSSGIDPVVIGNQVIFCQSNGKVIRNLGYSIDSDSFTGTDLRILSEHLFEGHTIVDMAYQQDNDSIVWMVRDDGVLLSLTYMYEQDVIAWAWHDTDGEVESICVIPGDGYDELWMSVNRDNGRYIERMVQRMESTDPADQIFMDSSISYDDPIAISNITQADPGVVTCSAAHGLSNGDYVDLSDIVGMTELNGYRYKVANVTTYTFELTEEDTGDDVSTTLSSAYASSGYVRKAYTSFSGLDHLEGQTVAILGNGEVYPQQAVSSGSITLSRACSKVHVGLPYISDLETLNIELGSNAGTTQGRKVKIGNVTFRLINSRGGWIGPDSDNLHEAFTPARLRLGGAPALYTGDVREALGASYTDGGRIFYRQIDPLPITISCVIPELSVSG